MNLVDQISNEEYSNLTKVARSRKIQEWEDAKVVDFEDLDEKTQFLILNELFRTDLKGVGTFDYEFDGQVQFYLGYKGNKYYFIDTQGSDYARYVSRLVGVEKFI